MNIHAVKVTYLETRPDTSPPEADEKVEYAAFPDHGDEISEWLASQYQERNVTEVSIRQLRLEDPKMLEAIYELTVTQDGIFHGRTI